MTTLAEPTTSLPLWPHQAEAVERIVDAFNRVNLVVVEGPTGSGKTWVAEEVRRRIAPFPKRSIYVCSSKGLQDQVLHDERAFGPDGADAKLLKGRSNYTPLTDSRERRSQIRSLDITCSDCTRTRCQGDESCTCPEPHDYPVDLCQWCDTPRRCPYGAARSDAIGAQLAVLNTAYFLTEANAVGRFSGRYLAIVDECDLLDQVLTGAAELNLSARRLKTLGWSAPPHVETGPRTTKVWRQWIEDRLPDLEQAIRATTFKAHHGDTRAQVQARRDLAWMTMLAGQLTSIAQDLEAGKESGWVRIGNDTKHSLVWRPVWPAKFAQALLWNHATKWLLMSATVLSAEEMVDRLGYRGPFEFVAMPSPIPPKDRPLHLLPVGDMGRSAGPEDRGKVVTACRTLTERHADQRVLIHTVSYALADEIVTALAPLGRPVFTYRSASEMDEAVDAYRSASDGVLVAPSLERGLDLPGDLCRAMIVAKVPYPFLGDAQVSSRLHDPSGNGQRWYSLEALRRIIQMSGRGVRGVGDTCPTYVLDRSFVCRLWPNAQRWAPKWWSAALQWRADSELLRSVGL